MKQFSHENYYTVQAWVGLDRFALAPAVFLPRQTTRSGT